MIKAHLRSLELAGGTTIAMDENSVVVFVGPNNSGKSSTLAAVRTHLRGEPAKPSSLLSISLEKTTRLEEIKASLAGTIDQWGSYSVPGHTFHESHLKDWWENNTYVVGPYMASLLVCELSTRSRLADCDPQDAVDLRNPHLLTHPFHKMYRDDELEKRSSEIFRAAFKRDLIVHRGSGNSIPVYIGERPALNAGEDRVSLTYLERLEALEKIELQGDGIRSFASIVTRVITENRPIQLIDEPEAFLPPPQARLIARSILAESSGRQTLIATHSSDVLRGLLADGTERLSVVRLVRPSSGVKAHLLEASQVADLWHDPILRFSNLLDGLFHDGVILTEADADCRFYEALSSACIEEANRPDIHYSYTGGKDRLPVAIKALIALNVPVATIADFDVLNNDQPLRRIIEAHGGIWADIEIDWRTVKNSVEENKAFTDGDRFRESVNKELQNYGNGTVVSKQTLKAIEKLAKNASAWGPVKSSGLAAIAPGGATVAANRLLSKLKALGIFVAPNGEMEGFCRSVGGHGPRWVATVLEQKDLVIDNELASARAFVNEINSYLLSSN